MYFCVPLVPDLATPVCSQSGEWAWQTTVSYITST